MRRTTSRARGESVVRPQSDCEIIPWKNEKHQTRFDSFEQFVFESVFRLIAIRLTDSHITAAEVLPKSLALEIRLWRDRVNNSVHSSSCAFHHTMRDVLCRNRCIFRHVPRRANRPGLNAANANSQREKY